MKQPQITLYYLKKGREREKHGEWGGRQRGREEGSKEDKQLISQGQI